jgi:hypothetical protein
MARLPVLHKRRRSKGQRALDLAKGAATVWTTVKVSSAGARAAKGGAKAYGAAKGAKVRGRSVVKLIAVPAAVVGGVAIFRKARGGHDHDHEADAGRPLGPVASADTVSPPPSATEAAERAETERAEAEQAETAQAEAHASEAHASEAHAS